MSDLNTKLGEITQIVTEMRSKTDRIEDAVTKSELKVLEDALKAEMLAVQEQLARKNAPKSSDPKEELEAVKAQVAELFVKGAQGFDTKTADEINFSVDAQGGFTLPRILDTEVTEILGLYSPIRALSTVRRGGANFTRLIKDSKTEARTRAEVDAWVSGETATYAEMTFGSVEINDEQAVSTWVMDGDAVLDHAANVRRDIVRGIGEKESYLYLNGTVNNVLKTGAGSSNVQMGLLNHTIQAGADRFTNVLGRIGGVEAGANGAVSFDDLMNLKASLHSNYKGTFVFGSDVFVQLAKTKDADGNYIWSLDNVVAGEPDRIRGEAFAVCDFMPELDAAAGSKLVLFGDFSKYVINQHADISFLVDPYTNKRVIKTSGRIRVGAGLVDFQAMRALTQKAAG